MNLTARAPLPALMRSLRHAGWGELTGREWQGVRSVLMAVVDSVDDGTGTGVSTAAQIADRAGLSQRWTRRCLHFLEDLGVLTWQRGVVTNGQPKPSFFRVIKQRIVDLVHQARPAKDERDRKHRLDTARRLHQTLKSGYAKSPPRRFRRSVHAELANSPLPFGGKPTGVSTPEQADPPSAGPASPGVRQAALSQMRRTLHPAAT